MINGSWNYGSCQVTMVLRISKPHASIRDEEVRPVKKHILKDGIGKEFSEGSFRRQSFTWIVLHCDAVAETSDIVSLCLRHLCAICVAWHSSLTFALA